MGIRESDPLPPPGPRPSSALLGGTSALDVPDWNDHQSDGVTEWLGTLSSGLLQDLMSDKNPYPKVNEEDKELSVILVSNPLVRSNRAGAADRRW